MRLRTTKESQKKNIKLKARQNEAKEKRIVKCVFQIDIPIKNTTSGTKDREKKWFIHNSQIVFQEAGIKRR